MCRKHDLMASYSVNFVLKRFPERRYDKNKKRVTIGKIKHDVNQRREMHCSDTVLRRIGG